MDTKGSVNPRLDVDVIHVAELFATSNLSPSDATVALDIITTLRRGSFGEAKIKMDEFTRPEFGTAATYFTRKQFTALLSKVPFRGGSKERKQKALDSFLSAERRCKRVNRKLKYYSQNPNRMPETTRIVLSRAREWIRSKLGPLNERVLMDLVRAGRPGSGVAIGTWNRFRVSAPFKYGATDLACTEASLPYAKVLVEGSIPWLSLHMEVDWADLTYHVPYRIANSNRVTFVPKDSRTMRTIAIEPHLNVMLQLGVHEILARKLERLGNSIEDQSRNQSLAESASKSSLTESLATLDLAQASDSISTELVRMLMPSDWFGYLDDLRCKTGDLPDGTPIVYEKFSSMGNGYTFALETLLFYALGWACNSLTGGTTISTYGDDIIVSDCSALLLTEVLRWTGFSINTEKSFYVGPFRESCGADWHHGSRVTPQYIKRSVFRPTDVYAFLNRVDPMFVVHPIRRYLLANVKKYVPVLFGLEYEDTSGCLFSTFDYVKGAGLLRWNDEIQNWQFTVIRFCSETPLTYQPWSYVAALRGSRGNDSRYALRGRGTFRHRTVTPGVTRDVPRYT